MSSTNTFISREKIQNDSHVQLPIFYDDKTEVLLKDLQVLFKDMVNPSTRSSLPSGNVRTSHWCHSLPTIIKINSDNTTNYNAAPLSFATFSTTHVNNAAPRVNQKPTTQAEKEREKEEAENNRRQMFGIASGVLMVGASYLVGQSLQELDEANEILGNLQELKGILQDTVNQKQNLYAAQMLPTSSVILGKQIEMLQNIANNSIIPAKRTNALRDLALRASLFASGVIGLIGAFVAYSKPLMKFSAAWLLITGCAWALKKGITSNKVEFTKTANKINQDISSLLTVLGFLPRTNAEGVVTISPIQAYNPYHKFGNENIVYFNMAPSAPPNEF